MNTLFLNTATATTIVALYGDDGLLSEKRWPAEQNESETLLPGVEALLEEAGVTTEAIDRLVVCIGPGGFTSTRVGVSAANAWSFAKRIPVAVVSAFDLYPGDQVLVFSANPNEAWIQLPRQDPQWVNQDSVELPDSFSFCGVVNDEWKSFLEERGGSFVEHEEKLETLDGLDFQNQIVKPWYYKDPNITLSNRFPLSGQT